MKLRKLLNQLPEPESEIEKISYQTILPYYDPEIINEYNKLSSGTGDKILNMIQKDIDHLNQSKKDFEKINKSFFGFFPIRQSWKEHLASCGWNVSGQYSENHKLDD